jgi:hypothetical protein
VGAGFRGAYTLNKDALYFHFANLGLIIIGIFSIYKIIGPIIIVLLMLGSISGFLFSWYIRNSRPPHIDTFIGMLSLASLVIVLSRLYETEVTFENLLKIFSTALVWLSMFQSFGLKAQKSYSLIQFISAALLISSVSMALESETVYVLYLAVFLFVLIFTMRLALVCEKQSRGSLIIGDRDEIMSLWHQIKVGAIMFSVILILSGLVYPAVPRFNSLSLSWIPSTLLGLPEKKALLKLMDSVNKTIKEDKKVKKELMADDDTKKRETKENKTIIGDTKEKKEVMVERFKASDFNKDIDAFKIDSLEIKSDKKEIALDQYAVLIAEIKLNDGSLFPATKLVDWKVTGTAKVLIDKDGKMFPKEGGYITISAAYMGVFSSDLNIKIINPVKPKKKTSFLFYFIIFILWIIAGAIVVFLILVFIRSQKLAEMRKNNPKEFIKEVYYALCKAFKIYGIPKFNYVSYREFYNLVKELITENPGPMQDLTEGFLEARFSSHEISAEHSQKAFELFHKVKDVILEREERNIFWKNILFRLYVMDVLLLPRQQS